MPQMPTTVDVCQGCGRKGKRELAKIGLGRALVLTREGLCANCAPVSVRCAKGELCEFDRIINPRFCTPQLLKKLRLCEAHDQERAAWLKDLRKSRK